MTLTLRKVVKLDPKYTMHLNRFIIGEFMNELYKIGDITQLFGVTGRTLRYYEEIGILESQRKDDSNYRYYNETSIQRLKQIITLRKLQIPVKDIQEIFDKKDINILLTKIRSKRDSVTKDEEALSILKNLLDEFMFHLIGKSLTYEEGLEILEGSENTNIDAQSDNNRDTVENAINNIEKLNKNEVRVINLKPFRVVVLKAVSNTPEKDVWAQTVQFVKNNKLDLLHSTRYFGFDNPSPQDGNPIYGYEMWITITDDFTTNDDVEIREIPNGLYAVTTSMSAAEIGERWKLLHNWVEESVYKTGNHQWLEEAIILDLNTESGNFQLDLYYPIIKENI